MWKTVNSVYKSANKNIKKLSKNIPSISAVSQSISAVSQSIQNIKVQKLIPKIGKTLPQSDVQKVIIQIFKNKKPVMPINKMSIIAQMSYENDKFQQICDLIFQKLRVFKYQTKNAKQTLNTLILLSYLIKNAASGFIDQFRQQITIFQQHSELKIQNAYITDQKQLQVLKSLLVEIRQRGKYIAALLTDKKKLLKQKQIAMQIKRKIIEGQGKSLQNSKNGRDNPFANDQFYKQSQNSKYQRNQKLQSFLQHYVWKYWNKFDQKMQNITQRIIQKIDQYLDMEQPQSFQIDQIQMEQKQTSLLTKTQSDIEIVRQMEVVKQIKIKQQIFLREKNQLLGIQVQMEDGPVLNTELV